MFRIGVVAQFEAAHRLHGSFGPATRTHGHTYRVEVTLSGDAIADDGTLFDIGALQQTVAAEVGSLHYQDLDLIEGLSSRNTTAENVAKFLHEHIAASLDLSGLLLGVRVWESPSAFAEYEGDPG